MGRFAQTVGLTRKALRLYDQLGILEPDFCRQLIDIGEDMVNTAFDSPIDAAPADQIEEAEQLGRYRIERKLGQGAMATVYLATHVALERQVALKIMEASLTDDDENRGRDTHQFPAAAVAGLGFTVDLQVGEIRFFCFCHVLIPT